MATPSLGFDNYFSTTLSADLSDSGTTINVNAAPTASEGFLVIEPDSTTKREIIYYTSKTASTVICPSAAAGRGVGGTTAQSHSSGVTVKMMVVAEMLEALQDGTGLLNALKDGNGNEWLEKSATASAVNHLKITNAATGNAPKLESVGDDTNTDFYLAAKGTGKVFNEDPSAGTANVDTSETTTSTSYTDLATTTDTVAVKIGSSGIALVSIYGFVQNSGANGVGWISVDLSGANTLAANDVRALQYQSYAANTNHQGAATFLLTGLTGGSTTFKLKYRVNAGTGTFANRRITVVAP